MSVKISYKVKCDRCHTEGTSFSCREVAEQQAVKGGWARSPYFDSELHLCVTCGTNAGTDWWMSGEMSRLRVRE